MKVLFIGPHPDDNELHCGGFAIKLLKAGHEVQFLSVCNGCGGHHILNAQETAARRAKEIAAVAQTLGIRYDVWEDVDDCNVMADLPTRKRMIRYIRSVNPDIVICNRTNDYHADHRNTAILVQDASYLLTVPNECPDAPAMRFMPVIIHSEDTFSNPTFEADFVIPIDDVMDTKYKVINLHVSQLYEWLPYTRGDDTVPEDPEERFTWLIANCERRAKGFRKTADRFRHVLAEQYGENKAMDVQYAEAYQLSEYGRKLSEEQLQQLLDL